jgi:hypothetical protein
MRQPARPAMPLGDLEDPVEIEVGLEMRRQRV